MAVVGVLSYVAFVLTPRGQRFDFMAFEGRKATDLGVRRALTSLMRTITATGVFAGCLSLLVAAARRGRWWMGAVAGMTVGAAVALAELLKFVLTRPHLIRFVEAPSENTFPSGHSTGVMALVLVWIWVAPRCGRNPRVMPCLVGLVAWVTAMVGSGWHRPSDVLGGLALATVVAAATCLGFELLGSTPGPDHPPQGGFEASSPILARSDEPRPPIEQPANESPSVGEVAAAGVGAVLASGMFVMSILNQTSDPRHSLGTYLVMVLLCNGIAALAVTLSWWGTGGSRPRPTAL